MSRIHFIVQFVAIITLPVTFLRTETIFDSRLDYPYYNVAETSGGPHGVASLFDVSENITVNGISLLSIWLDTRPIKFVIFDASNRELLYESPPVDVPRDAYTGSPPDVLPTWKSSPTFSFTLLAGHQYVIGSTSYSERLETYDYTPVNGG